MDLDDELDLLDNGTDTTYKGARPSFLTVLCILTFVGAGLGILYNFFTLFWVSTTEGIFSSITEFDDSGELNNSFTNAYRWIKWGIVAGVVGNLICLAGAIVMWTMRKIGFYIYVVGQGIPIVVTVLSYGSTFGGDFGAFGFIGLAISLVFPIGFIVMYGLNYKYLR